MSDSKVVKTNYEKWYECEGYYWGLEPAELCYEIEKLIPASPEIKVLDVGCGEGKDALYFAQKGYNVSCFDITESGIAKAKKLAEEYQVPMNCFIDDINDMQVNEPFDIIYSTGTIQYLEEDKKAEFFAKVKAMTRENGINWFNVFVEKPFMELPPDWDTTEQYWQTAELFSYYKDWQILKLDEIIFDCNSSGVPHKHCMDVIIAKKISAL